MKHSKRPRPGDNPGTSSTDPSDKPTISLSILRGSNNSRLTKRFSLDKDQHICKESQPNFSNGTAETVKIKKLAEIESIFENLASNECIATGIFDSSPCKIVTKENLDERRLNAGVRSRSKHYMQLSEIGLILLDHDPSSFMSEDLKCNTPMKLMEKMESAVPEFSAVAYSGAGSCSNGIYISETNEPYQGGGGIHVYIPVRDIELDELRHYLEVKLWNAGLGFMAFARNGAMLPRCIIDLSVLSPERLIYEAAPILGAGLSRKPQEWQHRGGRAFSGDLS